MVVYTFFSIYDEYTLYLEMPCLSLKGLNRNRHKGISYQFKVLSVAMCILLLVEILNSDSIRDFE